MPTWLITALTTVGSVVLTLTVTLLFNKLVALPKAIRDQRAAEEAAQAAREEQARVEREQLMRENRERDNRIATLQAAVDALPGYRAQSMQIQAQLQNTDREILETCMAIKEGVLENRQVLDLRLDRLERREKNALRQKILNEHRIFTDEHMNPMQALTEMEHHSFFKLVEDYEDLGGNDYVHSEVLPAMNRLRVIPMSDRNALYELMASRQL